MPKKKTGQRKKAEKQKLRQKEIRNLEKDLAEYPCEKFIHLTTNSTTDLSIFSPRTSLH